MTDSNAKYSHQSVFTYTSEMPFQNVRMDQTVNNDNTQYHDIRGMMTPSTNTDTGSDIVTISILQVAYKEHKA